METSFRVKKESAPSISSYAFRLRKRLLQGAEMDQLIDLHREHQGHLKNLGPMTRRHRLAEQERFAWKFLNQVNVLRPDFKKGAEVREGRGIFHDLDDIIEQTRRMWFPQMETRPKAVWLNRFSTRKLAHYNFKKDEIAFSLVFDSLKVPRRVLDFLAYHELLHKQVGVTVKNGKRYAHTPEFKRLEQLFPDHQEVERQITRYLMEP